MTLQATGATQALPRIAVGRHCCAESTELENYRPLIGDTLTDEIRRLAERLNGLRVCHINATAAGGGVAELLHRLIPLYQALGIRAEWRVIHGDTQFFTVTKGFHNGLQGAEVRLTTQLTDEYLEHNRLAAEGMADSYDVYMVHDPQPAAIRHFRQHPKSKWIWRCHIDSSTADSEVWRFLKPFIEDYDAAVFTMADFRPPDLHMDHVAYIPPAIDPLATKNMEWPYELCRKAIADYGVDLNRPLLLQVSRFDPWKDPLGVIQAYRLVKERHPKVQLALIGAMAGDDPEGWRILDLINAESLKDPAIHVFTNMTGVGNMEVNVFQGGADLVIQKSLKEGFGLVVSEALWKERPVVAGAAGGIPMQFPDGYEGYLVGSIEECAEKSLRLLEHPGISAEFGRAGRDKVRREFLLPRLFRDELALICDVVGR